MFLESILNSFNKSFRIKNKAFELIWISTSFWIITHDNTYLISKSEFGLNFYKYLPFFKTYPFLEVSLTDKLKCTFSKLSVWQMLITSSLKKLYTSWTQTKKKYAKILKFFDMPTNIWEVENAVKMILIMVAFDKRMWCSYTITTFYSWQNNICYLHQFETPIQLKLLWFR